MPLLLLVGFGLAMAAWFALGVLMDHRTTWGARVPERLAAVLLPGRLPSYVRIDAERARQARQARARRGGGTPPRHDQA